MADSQSKIDSVAEMAIADAAAKKTAEQATPEPVASEKSASAVDTDAVAKAVADEPAAAKQADVVKKIAGRKPAVMKSAAAKPVTRKAVSKKASKVPGKPSIAAKKSKPAPTISQLKDKIMATTNTDFTAKLKDGAADMQTRLKTAYDKGTEMTKDVTEFHKNNLEAMVESGKVLAAGMQDMGRTALETVKSDAEVVTEDVKKMASVKNPTELFQLQGEIARRNLDTMVSRASKSAEAWMKLANESFAPLSSRASVAMDRIKTAA
ncbi:TIGR01841 family phasin [Qipengyuania sp.]|uniref:phasin family protein n=1 Tax=Qipengyuania sp. TaxID=2004515 RepID=UPI0035C7BD6E